MNTERLFTFHFGQPWWLLLLLLVPLLAWMQGRAGGHTPALQYSAVRLVRKIGAGIKASRGGWPLRLSLIALALMILAMARPRIEQGDSPDKQEGVDIVLSVDVSGSMNSRDFELNGETVSRMDALILAIDEFVDSRPHDRLAMIGFARHTFLMSPLTLDGDWIKGALRMIKLQDGTAVGDGIVASLQVLQEAESDSKVIIVVTDGQNNSGLDPMTAAEQARAQGVRVHTIAIIRPQEVRVDAPVKSLLGRIAAHTGGLFFQASDTTGIAQVYRSIDAMEKSRFEQLQYRIYDELHPWFTGAALGVLLLGIIGGHTWWMRLP